MLPPVLRRSPVPNASEYWTEVQPDVDKRIRRKRMKMPKEMEVITESRTAAPVVHFERALNSSERTNMGERSDSA